MNNYLENIDPLLKEYFSVLAGEFPDFLVDYIETPRMQKQDAISCASGMVYAKMFDNKWYSSLDHSIAVALIIWHFTHDKKQTLSGLFHDISTPAFKHCIDFMNNDYENQESTEDLTKKMIQDSKEIMELLKKDNIEIDEVADYHIYPIADNDTPQLSSDRLEYTLSNGLIQIKRIWGIDEVRNIYSNIVIDKNEDGIDEMCFKDLKVAERFVEVMSELSILYMNDQRRFGMQFLVDVLKRMSNLGLVSVSDLYELPEKEIVNRIKNCQKNNISKCFEMWQNADDVKTSDVEVADKYCIKIKAKKRYINPLVLTNDGPKRIADISTKAKENIDKCMNYSFDRFIYMDFNFDNE